jgi:hypothetical protein|tara:strand:- start:1501 stop:1803 length:303 start_codon:yes stop_codon:yes gene_type:complete
MTVKKILFTASFVLMSLVFKADDHIKKDDIDKVLFTSSNKIIFKLIDGTSLQGNIVTKKTCPLNHNYHKIFFKDDLITNSLVVMRNNGFTTCKWENLTKI